MDFVPYKSKTETGHFLPNACLSSQLKFHDEHKKYSLSAFIKMISNI